MPREVAGKTKARNIRSAARLQRAEDQRKKRRKKILPGSPSKLSPSKL